MFTYLFIRTMAKDKNGQAKSAIESMLILLYLGVDIFLVTVIMNLFGIQLGG